MAVLEQMAGLLLVKMGNKRIQVGHRGGQVGHGKDQRGGAGGEREGAALALFVGGKPEEQRRRCGEGGRRSSCGSTMEAGGWVARLRLC